MFHSTPRKNDCKPISLVKLMMMVPDDDSVCCWFESKLWLHGPNCPKCGSFNIQCGIGHKTITHHCGECEGKSRFSLKTGNITKGSKFAYQTWTISIYLVMTRFKGFSSMNLHRDLTISRKSAWYLAHRLRRTFVAREVKRFDGPIKVDETDIVGKRKNTTLSMCKALTSCGAVGKATIADAKNSETNRAMSRAILPTDALMLLGFVRETTKPGATIYSNDAAAYIDLYGLMPEGVNHFTGEHVLKLVHTNTNGTKAFFGQFKTDLSECFPLFQHQAS